MNGLAISVLPPDTQLEDSVASVGFPSNVWPVCFSVENSGNHVCLLTCFSECMRFSQPQLRTRMVEAISRVAPRVRSVRALGTAVS